MWQIEEVSQPDDLAACRALRHEVFVVEQGVDPADEWDGLDGECRHWLARNGDGVPVGTARLRLVAGWAKAQRVAVRAADRGQGVGRALMAALESAARRAGCRGVTLGAQVSAMPFYAKLGYAARGPVFDDAGIPHRTMELVWEPGDVH